VSVAVSASGYALGNPLDWSGELQVDPPSLETTTRCLLKSALSVAITIVEPTTATL